MSAFAPRYANALADVVVQDKLDIAQVQQQLEDFATIFAGSKDLREALLNPAIPLEKRVTILDAVNRRIGLNAKVRNFLAVLMAHGRLAALKEVVESYRLQMNRRQGIAEAEVITARSLDGAERAEMEHQVGEMAKSTVRATFREDASLIGGGIVRIGSMVYDGSIRGRLEQLRERLVAN